MADTLLASDRSDRAHEAFHRRYREALPDAGGSWNDALRTMLNHRSVRNFLPDPLPEGALETIIAAAQSAPSSSNGQSWSVVAVTGPERKSQLAAVTGGSKYVSEAPVFLVWVADLARYGQLALDRGVELDGLAYTDTFVAATVDCTLAAQNALVAAESLGLGTLCVGGLRNDAQRVADVVGLPPQTYAVFGMALGYPDPAVPTAVKPRLPQAAVLHHETYSHAAQRDAIARHDRHTRDFRREQGLDDASWTDLMVNRLAKAASLNGRELLRDALVRVGFRLE